MRLRGKGQGRIQRKPRLCLKQAIHLKIKRIKTDDANPLKSKSMRGNDEVVKFPRQIKDSGNLMES